MVIAKAEIPKSMVCVSNKWDADGAEYRLERNQTRGLVAC